MGLARAAVSYLIEEAKRQPFSGTALTLGVQNVFLTEAEIERLADQRGFTLAPVPEGLTHKPLMPGYASSEWLFRRLGFERLVTTDVDGFEGADLIFDLNAPNLPTGHSGAYDLVLDGGTLEHVFHVPNAIRNIMGFARIGGRILHMSPSSNHIDHGFYMFSPTFFHDVYAANAQRILSCELFRYPMPGHEKGRWLMSDYRPGSLQKVSMGGLGGGCWGVAALIEKTRDVETLAIPQQGAYTTMWASGAKPKKSQALHRRLGRGLAKRWKRGLRNTWLVLPTALRLRLTSVSRGLPLKLRRRL